MNTKAIIILIIIIVGIIGSAALAWYYLLGGRLTNLPPAGSDDAPLAASLASNLEIPWALDFLPDGSIVLTERPGRIRYIDSSGELRAEPLLTVSDVAASGEGGLLGIAVHPDFSQNGYIYIYHTYQDSGRLANRVVRYAMQGLSLTGPTVIIDGIPGASNHNGGRIKFGPDGLLYITTGDAGDPDQAQDLDSLAGKILRLEDDGGIPSGNPFPGSPVYSYGHRNPQGLAWDNQDRLWATEHGDNATDELNRIIPGGNYGWPVIRSDQQAVGMIEPVLHSGAETWAPSGMTFLDDSLFFVGLRGQTLYQAAIDGDTVTLKRHLPRSFGRLRDAVVGPDGLLYVLTSNRDGRGLPTSVDDQLVVINPGKL